MRNRFIEIEQYLQLIKKLLRLNNIFYIAKNSKERNKKIDFCANKITCLTQLTIQTTLLY